MGTPSMTETTIETFTIGFTKKSAESFFTKLHEVGVQRVLDVRLHNSSQLAGFAKLPDLEFFLKGLFGIEYLHLEELAPTKDILDAYKKHKGDWSVYESEYLALLDKRSVESSVPADLLAGGCLLCSEHLPEHCHRRVALDYLQQKWGKLAVTHLV